MQKPKFQKSTPFHQVLKSRVQNHFKENNIQQTGNTQLYIKALVLTVSFVGVYLHLLFFTPVWPIAILESIVLGGLAASIGFNVMHDGAHGSFSNHQWLNKLAGISINFLGANVFMWKTKHNVVHHSYTNIEGVDDDMNARPFLRLCPAQKRYGMHKYQHFYFLFTYSLLYHYWVFVTDYKKYITGKVGITPIQKMKVSDHVSFWGFKLVHAALFMALPIYLLGFLPWLVGFLFFGFSTGIFLSVIFQMAHSVEETIFPINEGVKLEDDWATHQLRTTANFATKNKVLTWLVGGLNFQVEHHLFPKISHIHYPAISKIIKDVCQEYQVPYLEHSRLRQAFASHYYHLKALGTA